MKLVNNYVLFKFNRDGVFMHNHQQLLSNHTRTELYWSKRPSNCARLQCQSNRNRLHCQINHNHDYNRNYIFSCACLFPSSHYNVCFPAPTTMFDSQLPLQCLFPSSHCNVCFPAPTAMFVSQLPLQCLIPSSHCNVCFPAPTAMFVSQLQLQCLFPSSHYNV